MREIQILKMKDKIIITKIRIEHRHQLPFLSQDSQEDNVHLRLKQLADQEMLVIWEYNICKIMVLKKLYRDKQQATASKKHLHMKHLFLEKNWKNGELNFGVSKIFS